MTATDPLKWGRLPAPIQRFEGHPKQVCQKLNEIFVDQFGIAHQIDLKQDPKTGQRYLHFQLEESHPVTATLQNTRIEGIPVKLTFL